MRFQLPWVSRRRFEAVAAQHAKEQRAIETEIMQIRRAGVGEFSTQRGVSADEFVANPAKAVKEAKDPRALLLSLDNMQASEVKFRLVKTVNRELRDVLRSMIRTVNSVADKPVNRVTLNHLKALQAEVAQAEPWAS